MKKNLFNGDELLLKISGKELRGILAYAIWNIRGSQLDTLNMPVTLEKITDALETIFRDDPDLFKHDFILSEDEGIIFTT